MDKKGGTSIVRLTNYIQPIINSMNENVWTIENNNSSRVQYLPWILDFIQEVLNLSEDDNDFLKIINQQGWWDRKKLEASIPQMTEKEIRICLKAIIHKERISKGLLLQYFGNGVITRLLQRLMELKPFYKMTRDELECVDIGSLDAVNCELYLIASSRMNENEFPQTDIYYEEFVNFYEESKVQERINQYLKMTFEELEKLTHIRSIFNENLKTGRSIFEEIKNIPEELGKFDISEMTDEEFAIFYECYKKELNKKIGSR